MSKLEALPGRELRRRRLSSGWTPIELLKHLAHDELRWLEWRFEGRAIAVGWADGRDGRWYVAAGETLHELVAALHAQAARSRAIVESHDLADLGQPGVPAWARSPVIQIPIRPEFLDAAGPQTRDTRRTSRADALSSCRRPSALRSGDYSGRTSRPAESRLTAMTSVTASAGKAP